MSHVSEVSSAAPRIVIVGLGPGDRPRRTIVVQDALDAADRILVRTLGHPGLEDLAADARVQDVSAITSPSPGNTREWATGAVIACDLAEAGHRVVVAVPGHPFYGERLVRETLAESSRRGIETLVHDGLSTLDLVSTSLQIDAMIDEVQIVDGAAEVHRIGNDPYGGGLFPFTSHRPLVISRVYTQDVMAGVQRLLLRILPTTHPVTVVDAAGSSVDESVRTISLGDLGDEVGGYRVTLFVPALDHLAGGRDAHAMQQISARLRRPDGCPWDRVQTHESLRESFIDEVYEVLDAIDRGDVANLAEELGDLFLLITLQAQIAEEHGEFTLEDVYESSASKIVRRHPHVFAGERAETQEDLSRIWKRVKAEEKASSLLPRPEKDFDGEPHSKPAITRAARILAKHLLDAVPSDRTATERRDDLLHAVAAIIEAGDDPDTVLLEALRAHHHRTISHT